MFGSQILEVAIGMIFIFLLVSVVCSAVREGLESLLKTRAAYLENGIRKLLNDTSATGIAKNIFAHPQIRCLFGGDYASDGKSDPAFFAMGGNLPSYIPSKNFATALMDIAARGPITDETGGALNSQVVSLDSLRANIRNIDNPAVQRVLLTAVDSAQGDLGKVQANLEAWYNSAMDRVSGWYKRTTQWIIFWIALALAIGLNVNSLALAHHLYTNAAARAALVRTVEDATKKGELPTVDAARVVLTDLNGAPATQDLSQLPIGWAGIVLPPHDLNGTFTSRVLNDWVVLIFGWLMTAFAASMGAPFWFDMLNKVITIRSTIKPHEKSPEEGSKDWGAGPQPTVANSPANAAGIPAAPVAPAAPAAPVAPAVPATPAASAKPASRRKKPASGT